MREQVRGDPSAHSRVVGDDRLNSRFPKSRLVMTPTPRVRPSTAAPTASRTALVTGGAKRIGASIALALAERGWDVAIHYSTSAREARTMVAAIERLGRRAIALDADLSDENASRGLIARVEAALSRPTCLVNNASLFEADDAATFAYATLESHMRINLAAPLVLSQALHRALGAKQRGVVINLLDQKLFNPNPDYLSYTLSKAALQSATTLLARALAPKLRVVGIAPGITLPSGGQTRKEFRRAHAKTPLGRSSAPADIAAAVCFAIECVAVTGTTLVVDGGQHLIPTERDIMFATR